MSFSHPAPLVRQRVRELIACLIAQADPNLSSDRRSVSAAAQPSRRRRARRSVDENGRDAQNA